MDPKYQPFMHFTIETAIDLLLKADHPEMVTKLLVANLLRSQRDRQLLTRVLVWKEHRTDSVTLVSTETLFRKLVGEYAAALALPWPLDTQALAWLGVRLAEERY